MLLGQSDEKRKSDVGASQGLENFSKEEHRGGGYTLIQGVTMMYLMFSA